MSSTIDINALEPVSIHILMIHLFGKDYILWDPYTRKTMLERKGYLLNLEGENKLEALVSILVADLPFLHFEVFEKVAKSLVGHIPNFSVIEASTPVEISYAVHCMKALSKTKFSEEVKKYIAAVFITEGYSLLPKELNMAKPYFDEQTKNKPLVKHFQKLNLNDENSIKAALADENYAPQIRKLLVITNYLRNKEEKLRKENI